jgi:hypothetical protein
VGKVYHAASVPPLLMPSGFATPMTNFFCSWHFLSFRSQEGILAEENLLVKPPTNFGQSKFIGVYANTPAILGFRERLKTDAQAKFMPIYRTLRNQ